MKIKQALFMVVAGLVWASHAATPTITSATAQQRYPVDGKVDISITFSGTSNDVARMDCAFVATNRTTWTVLPVAHVTDTGAISGADASWTRHYVWDASADVGEVRIEDVALRVETTISPGGVQLWEGGPYWAECNVGALQPEEYGYYYQWGGTHGYRRHADGTGWVSPGQHGASFEFGLLCCSTYDKNNDELRSRGYIDSTDNLVATRDAATEYLGTPWRMPTDAEFSALVSNCTTTWTTRNGVKGLLVTGRGTYASKSIFLPAAGRGSYDALYASSDKGYYWSSTPCAGNSKEAWYHYFESDYANRISTGRNHRDRFEGMPVRPLRGLAE